MQAAASALMEELEVWAAEAILPAATRTATMDELGPEVATLYSSVLAPEAPSDWRKTPLCWLQAVDLLTGREWPVPAALVDTVYTVPSPHPRIFPRTTTGLGAGLTMGNAILQGALEILERHGVSRAHATPQFFDLHQIDPDSVRGALGSRVLNLVRAAGLLVGIWQVRASHDLPIYWCHVMESAGSSELAPLPAAGYGCDLTHDGALAKALMEACQARLTAISGAREDITRAAYPTSFDRDHLAAWRDQLQSPARARALARERAVDSAPLDAAIVALEREGARAVLVVPLHQDQMVGICVVRLVAPPLRSAPGL
jgi:ribosomal protein S12 methylthiotransferase accessory factor